MLIRAIADVSRPGHPPIVAGQVVDVADAEGEVLVRDGVAVAIRPAGEQAVQHDKMGRVRK